MSGAAMANVRKYWGAEAPDWVTVLAEECDRASQERAGKAIGRSAALVNQVLKRRYPGDLTAVEERVKAAFLAATVVCPELGEIPTINCLDHQGHAKRGNRGSTFRVAMHRACRTQCPHSRIGGHHA
jgi:hypothetical protein